MSSIKWLISPAVNTLKSLFFITVLFLFLEKTGLADVAWIPIGTQDGLTIRLNPKVNLSGVDDSVVSYELMVTAPQEVNGVRYSIVQLMARCNSRLMALTELEAFNDKGQSVSVTQFDIHHREDWQTPQNDIYGHSYNIVCNR